MIHSSSTTKSSNAGSEGETEPTLTPSGGNREKSVSSTATAPNKRSRKQRSKVTSSSTKTKRRTTSAKSRKNNKKSQDEDDDERATIVGRDVDGEPFYAVDSVLEERFKKVGRDKYTYEYRLKWVGYETDDDPQFYPAENLTDETIQKFKQEQKEKQKAAAASLVTPNTNQKNKRKKKMTDEKNHSYTNQSTNLDQAEMVLGDLEAENLDIRVLGLFSTEELEQEVSSGLGEIAASESPPQSKTKTKRKRDEQHDASPSVEEDGMLAGQDSDGEELWEVDDICDHRMVKGVHQYLVKWKNSTKCTWTPEGDFTIDYKEKLVDYRRKKLLETAREKIAQTTTVTGAHRRQLPLSNVQGKPCVTPTLGESSSEVTVDTDGVAANKELDNVPRRNNARVSKKRSANDIEFEIPPRISPDPVEDPPQQESENQSQEVGDRDIPPEESPVDIQKSIQNNLLKLASCPACKRPFALETKLDIPIMSHRCNHTVCTKCIAKATYEGGKCEWISCPVDGCDKEECFSTQHLNKNNLVIGMIMEIQKLASTAS